MPSFCCARTRICRLRLEEEPPRKEGGDPRIFWSLIDGHSELGGGGPSSGSSFLGTRLLGMENRITRTMRSLIVANLQLIDANQDNYLEECLKIRNVLAEFEQYSVMAQSPYMQWGHKDFKRPPVAIVGAREYIFSENIGILGDLAAGKEQTFGTLSARSMA